MFPQRRVLLSVPLEQLNLKTEDFWFAALRAHPPQIDSQLPGYRHDGFFAGSTGS
jgi:hypothetical protein